MRTAAELPHAEQQTFSLPMAVRFGPVLFLFVGVAPKGLGLPSWAE